MALTIAMLLNVTAFADKIGSGTVSGEDLPLQEDTGAESTVLSLLPSGAELEVMAQEGEWYLVSYRSLMGYVRQDSVDFTPVIAVDEAAELALSMVSVQEEEAEPEEPAETENTQAGLQQEIVDYACSLIGCRYKYGGTTPGGGFDCSGFTMYVYGQFGYSLPHSSSSQINYGTPVDKSALQMGDLILFSNGGPISHVGIYIGGGRFVHASSSRTGYVVVSALSESYWVARYAGARRLVSE